MTTTIRTKKLSKSKKAKAERHRAKLLKGMRRDARAHAANSSPYVNPLSAVPHPDAASVNDKPRVNYQEYITSKEWCAFRQRWFNSSLPKTCLGCFTANDIQLHHVTYARLGHERLKDCVPLCERCHTKFHETYSSKQVGGIKKFVGQLSEALQIPVELARARVAPFIFAKRIA